MKRRLMASVLLAGMVFSLPVYADDDRTPDEYDPNARYESPLTQQQPVIVNDRPARKPDDGDRFAEAAGLITQGAASGKNKDEKKATVKDEAVLQAEQKAEKRPDAKKQQENTPLPLVITGDDARYANDSGDFVIEGNVRMEQGTTCLSSTKAVGNAKTGDVWLLTGGTLQEPSNTVQVQWAHYNFNNKTGELRHIEGVSLPDETGEKKDLYRAPHAVV